MLAILRIDVFAGISRKRAQDFLRLFKTDGLKLIDNSLVKVFR